MPDRTRTASAFSPILMALSIVLLMGLGLWAYWPGVDGPDLLDDRSSVLNIQQIDGSGERAADYILSDRSGLLGRYLPVATFVAERYFGEADLRVS